MKVAIYCRVSTDEQTTENQKIRLIEYATKSKYEYEIFEEKESSRKTRPVKYRLFERLRAKEFDAVLVWRLDRWGRSSSELIMETEELQKRGVAFISLSDNFDLTTSVGKLQLGLLSSFAQFERDLIRERTIEGIYRARNQGKILGRPKGQKDRKKRKKGGYFLREARVRQKADESKGLWKPIDYYLDNTTPNK